MYVCDFLIFAMTLWHPNSSVPLYDDNLSEFQLQYYVTFNLETTVPIVSYTDITQSEDIEHFSLELQ